MIFIQVVVWSFMFSPLFSFPCRRIPHSNEYLVARFFFDADENESSEVFQKVVREFDSDRERRTGGAFVPRAPAPPKPAAPAEAPASWVGRCGDPQRPYQSYFRSDQNQSKSYQNLLQCSKNCQNQFYQKFWNLRSSQHSPVNFVKSREILTRIGGKFNENILK